MYLPLKRLLLAALLLYVLHTKAQPPDSFTLEVALKKAEANSKQLQLDSLSILQASSRIRQNQQAQLPQASAALSYLRISDNITPFKVDFPTGPVVLNPQILNQSYNNLQLRQLVWAGGKLRQTGQLLELEQKQALLELAKDRNKLKETVTTTWYQLFTAGQSAAIIEANITLLSVQRRDAENFVKQGVLLGSDALRLDLAVTQLQTALSQLRSNQQVLRFNLAVLTGTANPESIELPAQLQAAEAGTTELKALLEKAAANRPELQQLQMAVQQSELGVKLAKSNYLPSLSAGALYNYDQPNQRLFPNQATLTGTWNAGVFLNWNLSDLYTNKERVRESKLAQTRTTLALEQATDGIRMEVHARYNQYLQAKAQVELARKAVQQATENFRVAQNRFRENTTTATEFLDANTQLLQARINLTTALANTDLNYRNLINAIN